MKYVESFKKLGYTLKNNYAWSAENEAGICISIWTDQTELNSHGMLSVDFWKEHEKWEMRGEEPPFKKQSNHTDRTAHLQTAMDSFDGRVDVVLVKVKKLPTGENPKSGELGREIEEANPWLSEKRGGFWQVTEVCPETGYFRAEVVKL